MFQYISCCYLSFLLISPAVIKIKFQYISCCYLSFFLKVDTNACGSFNTSHVVIYQSRFCRIMSTYTSFNTSHVVIYQNWDEIEKVKQVCFNTSHVVIYQVFHKVCKACSIVSIHLMLLFIKMCIHSDAGARAFQYISCCYLSWKN